MTDWFANDELFRSELEAGHEWARLVAERLQAAGIAAALTPMAWRRDVDDRGRFNNERDVEVETGRGTLAIEVKSRRLAFTDEVASYPYDTALVDTVSGWEAKRQKPVAVVLVSRKAAGILVVSTRRTRDLWTVKHTHDRVRGIDDQWYQCPAALLLPFRVLSDWLASLGPAVGAIDS